MKWEDDTVKYTVNQIGCDSKFIVTEKNIKPFKEETMELNIVNNDCNNLIINTTTDLQDNKVIFDANAQCCDITNNIIKEETMEEKNGQTEITIEYYFEESSRDRILRIPNNQEIVIENGRYILRNKKPQYPKTYEECCKILDWNHRDYDRVGYKSNLLCKLQLLILCRDAYWKIAGKQLGLDKPWKPDWEDEYETYYTISYCGVNIKCYNDTDVYSKLAFPTEEMRDAFYGNFRKLIEQCKELL